MRRLARSTLSDKHCYKCDTLLVSNTIRYINGGMHECAVCPKESKLRIKPTMSHALNYAELNVLLVKWYQEQNKELELQLGLMKISRDHKATLLNSCESALEREQNKHY